MLLGTSVEEQHQNISESILLVTGTETEEYFEPSDTGMSCFKKQTEKNIPLFLKKTHIFFLNCCKDFLIYITVTNSKAKLKISSFFIIL